MQLSISVDREVKENMKGWWKGCTWWMFLRGSWKRKMPLLSPINHLILIPVVKSAGLQRLFGEKKGSCCHINSNSIALILYWYHNLRNIFYKPICVTHVTWSFEKNMLQTKLYVTIKMMNMFQQESNSSNRWLGEQSCGSSIGICSPLIWVPSITFQRSYAFRCCAMHNAQCASAIERETISISPTSLLLLGRNKAS